MRLIRSCVVALVGLLLLPVLAAPMAHAEDPTLSASVVSVSEGQYPLATVVLNIQDTSGGGLGEVTRQNFKLDGGGSALTVVSAELASSENDPLDAVLAIDTSGSMAGAPLAAAKDAAHAFIGELDPADRVAIIGFGDNVQLLLDYTSDRGAINATIEGLVAQGNTALYQATAVAAYQAGQSRASRRAIIMLSDGADFGGRSIATRDEALQSAQGVAVPFFTIAQGSDLDRAYLQELATRSNGRYLEAPNPSDLQSLYVGLGRLLRSQYIVTFDASPIATQPEVPLRVTFTTGERSATVETLYRPSPGFAPVISITGILPGETIAEPRELGVTVNTPNVTKVTWFVDGSPAAESLEQPFIFQYDPEAYGDGAHQIKVIVDSGGEPLETTLDFSFAPASSGGGAGLPLVPIAGIFGIVVLAGGAAMFVLRKRANTGEAPLPVDQRIVPWAQQLQKKIDAEHEETETGEPPVLMQEEIGEPMGVLISRSGPDLGSEYQVGGSPVSIGSAARCGVRVNDPDMSAEEARIWVRGGHLMLHKFTKLNQLAADGTVGGWTILETGDTFDIGGHAFEFKMLPHPGEEQEIPNILKDPDLPQDHRPQSQPPRPLPTPPATTPGADPAQPRRLAELMPRDEDGIRRADEAL
jgi:uncharacterized protein YegL